ncbi:MAG TPA: hypothetical protein VGI64_13675 [Streptosporangiaceae bacterium]
MRNLLSMCAILAGAIGLVVSAVLPASATSSPPASSSVPASPTASPAPATPTISIAAKSQLPTVTGDVSVAFHDGSPLDAARLSGKITNAVSGDVVRLLAQPFPYHAAPARLRSLTLSATGTDAYKFTVRPQIATRYTVELFDAAAPTTVQATSRRQPIYIQEGGTTSAPKKCHQPVCTEVIRLRLVMPASAVKRESAKHWHVYVGVRTGRAAGHVPSIPRSLKLDTKAVVAKADRVSADTYKTSFRFSLRVGRAGFRWVWTACTKDTEAKDGFALPGHHSCGDKKLSSKVVYLG